MSEENKPIVRLPEDEATEKAFAASRSRSRARHNRVVARADRRFLAAFAATVLGVGGAVKYAHDGDVKEQVGYANAAVKTAEKVNAEGTTTNGFENTIIDKDGRKVTMSSKHISSAFTVTSGEAPRETVAVTDVAENATGNAYTYPNTMPVPQTPLETMQFEAHELGEAVQAEAHGIELPAPRVNDAK